MRLDVIYLAWNRLEFTKRTWSALLENTDWDLVDALYVYDDASDEEDATFWLSEQMRHVPVLANFIGLESHLGSPVRIMNEYLDQSVADLFAKVDNDIMMPKHWLQSMLKVMRLDPGLEMLGAEQGMSGSMPTQEDPVADADFPRGYESARHVGGVGLFRTSAFLARPRVRPNGRFGFTEWQHEHQPRTGWITPDLLMTDLSRMPLEPYNSLSELYVKKNWQRNWPKSDPLRSFYWDWWYKQEQVEA